MKYKCLTCGQIINNNDICPICGSDSSSIVPLDEEEAKGHYRCLNCGRESEDGHYCPYCGSDNLFDLDTRTVQDTQAIKIEEMERVEEFSLFDDVELEQPKKEPEDLESRYLKAFGELLELSSIQNPDPEKVNALYRMGLNRGSKITPQEIANTFNPEVDEDEDYINYEQNTSYTNIKKENVEEKVEEDKKEDSINNTPMTSARFNFFGNDEFFSSKVQEPVKEEPIHEEPIEEEIPNFEEQIEENSVNQEPVLEEETVEIAQFHDEPVEEVQQEPHDVIEQEDKYAFLVEGREEPVEKPETLQTLLNELILDESSSDVEVAIYYEIRNLTKEQKDVNELKRTLIDRLEECVTAHPEVKKDLELLKLLYKKD